jgi:dolichol-phosphate mannosyltransferase
VVDDHSRDATFAVVQRLAAADRRVRGVRLARNSGSHIAIACALDEARGDAAVVLAADLQDPPETLPQLLARWREGAQVVWAARRLAPGQRPTNGAVATLYYWMMRRVLGMTTMPAGGADFFLVDRAVIDAVRQFRETHVSILALITWLGFRQSQIEYDKQPRLHGASGWGFRRKVKLVLDSLIAFSDLPIAFCWIAGLVLAGLSAVLAVAGFAGVAVGVLAPPFVVLLGAIGLVGGLILVMLGIVGEYVWRTLDHARGRPRYVLEARTADAQVARA